jgi:hypothetical protein
MSTVAHRLLLLAAVLPLAACMRGAQTARLPASAGEVAAVYAVVLHEIYRGSLPDTVVATDSTLLLRAPSGGVPWWGQRFDSIPSELPASLVAASAPRIATATLPLPRPVRVLSAAEIRSLFREGPHAGWEQFHRRFPDARLYLALSPVAFGADNSQALVYYEYYCGGLCGAGNAVWLTREPTGMWVVRKTIGFWVS